MVLNHTNSGAQPHQLRYQAMALTRTTGGAHGGQYSGSSWVLEHSVSKACSFWAE